MTAPTVPLDLAVPPVTTGLRALLAGFPAGGGRVWLDAWTVHGFGHQTHQLEPPVSALPLPLLALLEDRWGIRVGVATREPDGTPATLVYATAVWRPVMDFSAATDWRYRPTPEAVVAIAAALRECAPPPTFVIDGVHELVALWALASPIDLRRDAVRAVALQQRMATRLGADPTAAEDLACLVPLPGSLVRNLGSSPPAVTFVDVAPARVTTPDQLAAAGAEPPPPPARRKGASS